MVDQTPTDEHMLMYLLRALDDKARKEALIARTCDRTGFSREEVERVLRTTCEVLSIQLPEQ